MKRDLTRWAGLLAATAIIFAACSSGGTATTAPSSVAPSESASTAPSESASASASAAAGGFEQFVADAKLLADAKAEGTLSTIALPHDWCNYGESISTFKERTGLEVNELDPNAGSGDEVEAIKANKDNPGPSAPDVIDVGLSFGPQAKSENLLQAYKVKTWDDIPADAKDAEGFWWGDYYGVLSFEVNTAGRPERPGGWQDLLKPEYNGQVALAGDPRDVQPGHPGRVCVGARQRRVTRQRAARSRLLQEAQ